MSAGELDQAAKEAFAGQMLGVINGASLALLCSIGHRTRLFDHMAELPPSTSAEIAAAAGLVERYVREWLGGMVTGRIVDYAAATGRYSLPAERAASLTRAAGPDNFAAFAQYVSLLGNVEGRIVECFEKGGGVPYSAYPEFQRLQGEESARVQDVALLSITLPLVEGLTARLQQGIDAADLGCGQGHALNLMAGAYPASRFTGYDFSAEGMAAGRSEAERLGLANVRFVEQDLSHFEAPTAYDFVTAFDSIHDQPQPTRLLGKIAEALRDDGVFLMQDIAGSSNLEENLEHPLAPTLYTASAMHCMTVSLSAGGEGLGTMWGEQTARSMLAAAGFTGVDVKQVKADPFNNYYIARKA